MRGLRIAVFALAATPLAGCQATDVLKSAVLGIAITVLVVFVIVSRVAAQIRNF